MITTDQQRWDTLGIYGCEAIQTPHIDSIGIRGRCFDNARVVSPWCLPSRCSLLTGLYPKNHGAYSNFGEVNLDPEIPNLYQAAREAGFSTAHFGKCHYESVAYGSFAPNQTLNNPLTRDSYLKLGIDHLALQDDKNVSVWQFDDYSRELDKAGFLETYRKEAWNKSQGGVFPFPGPKDWHPDSWVGNQAADFIQEWDGEENLFIWVSFSGPHYPIDPPAEYLERVDADKLPPMEFRDHEWSDPSQIHYQSFHGGGRIDGCAYTRNKACGNYDEAYWKKMRTYYLANVALIDDMVGRVLQALTKNFGDDAWITFCSDHGDLLGNHRLWGKHNCGYEEVLKVPFLLYQPGDEAPGQRISECVQSIDLYPTLRRAMGLPDLPVDGAHLDDVIQQGGYRYTMAQAENFVSIDDGRFKLIRARVFPGESSRFELFDLSKDPHCFDNIYADPAMRSVIQRLLDAVWDEDAEATLFPGESHA